MSVCVVGLDAVAAVTGIVSYDIILVGGDMVAISLPIEGVLDWTLPMEGKGREYGFKEPPPPGDALDLVLSASSWLYKELDTLLEIDKAEGEVMGGTPPPPPAGGGRMFLRLVDTSRPPIPLEPEPGRVGLELEQLSVTWKIQILIYFVLRY